MALAALNLPLPITVTRSPPPENSPPPLDNGQKIFAERDGFWAFDPIG
jgi:hypothetical protein